MIRRVGELRLELVTRTEELRQLRQPARTIPALPNQPLPDRLDQFLVLIENDSGILKELSNRRRRLGRSRVRLERDELLQFLDVLPPRQSFDRVFADDEIKLE